MVLYKPVSLPAPFHPFLNSNKFPRLHQIYSLPQNLHEPGLPSLPPFPDQRFAEQGLPSLPTFPDRRFAEPIQLPSLRQCHHFINLTNGLEALPSLQAAGINPAFVRIQSTLCEQQQLERLINELDANLLLQLALGQCCLIYDFGSRNKKRAVPRALWYGCEWIRYALSLAWDIPPPATSPKNQHRAFLRGHDARAAFDGHIRKFTTSTKRKLKYYSQYLPPNGLSSVQLYGVYRSTEHDVDFDYYRNIAHNCLLPGAHGAESNTDIDQILDGDIHVAVQKLFGMDIFLGGLSHAEYNKWKEAQRITSVSAL